MRSAAATSGPLPGSGRPHPDPGRGESGSRRLRSSPSAARLVRPSWRDRRVVLGLLLVLGSTVLGARLLGTGPVGVEVWTARSDLAAGIALRESDLRRSRVELAGSAEQYLAVSAPFPVGRLLVRAVTAGELVPVSALAPASGTGGTLDGSPAGSGGDRRSVTIPVERFHVADDLARGEQVDVYVSPDRAGELSGPVGADGPTPLLVAEAAEVVDVDEVGGRFGDTGAARGVTVSVPRSEVASLVGGLARGGVDLIRVPGGTR